MRMAMTHDYWTALSTLGRAAIDYTAAIAKAHDEGAPPGSDAVIDSLKVLAHLSISFTVQAAIDLGHDAKKFRELERALIVVAVREDESKVALDGSRQQDVHRQPRRKSRGGTRVDLRAHQDQARGLGPEPDRSAERARAQGRSSARDGGARGAPSQEVTMRKIFIIEFGPPPTGPTSPWNPRLLNRMECVNCGWVMSIVDNGGMGVVKAEWHVCSIDKRTVGTRDWRAIVRDAFLDDRDAEAIAIIAEMEPDRLRVPSQLRKALAEAIVQIEHHNREYKHVTADADIERWKKIGDLK
jgi:hypothetical protein